MSIKSMGLLFVFVMFLLLPLLNLLVDIVGVAVTPDDEHAIEAIETTGNQLIPWWVEPLEWFNNIPGQLGALATLAFILFLKWIGAFK